MQYISTGACTNDSTLVFRSEVLLQLNLPVEYQLSEFFINSVYNWNVYLLEPTNDLR